MNTRTINSFSDLKWTPQINPSLIDPLLSIYAKEEYSILNHPEIIFYKRMEAIKKTQHVAKTKHTEIVILLNGTPFCQVHQDGSYTYIYNPDMDNESSPWLKEFFVERGYAIN